jgi:hypothetical protein
MRCSHLWMASRVIIRLRWPTRINPKQAFVTHWGTFVYDIMPFGLKNAGATYQRVMVTLFHDMIHHEIEVYVDDMIAKSRTSQDHLVDLHASCSNIEEILELRLNPNKCAYSVSHLGSYWASLSAAGELRLILQRFKLYEVCSCQKQRKRSEVSWEGSTT